MLKNKTLLCISFSTYPTVPVNKQLTEEYPLRDEITSEFGTCVLLTTVSVMILHYDRNTQFN